MSSVSFKLLTWANQVIAPAIFSGKLLDDVFFKEWRDQVIKDTAEWLLEISLHLLEMESDQQAKKWLKSQQLQAVMVSDLINRYLFRDQKKWSSHPQSRDIKARYGQSLSCLQDMLDKMAQQFPDIYDPEVKFTDYRLRNELPAFRHSVSDLKLFLIDKGIAPELIGLINKGLNTLLQPGKISPVAAGYITDCIRQIRSLNGLTERRLIELLLRLDFNLPDFYLYLAESLNDRLREIDGLHEAMEFVLLNKDDLRNVRVNNSTRLYSDQAPLKQELQCFYAETVASLEELLVLRRHALQDRYDSEHAYRLPLSMPVPQFALFVRLLKEKRIVLKDGITELCTFFARHFYTDKATFISAQNLVKRSTDVEFATVLKLWDMLTGMLDWLDEHFSVRNYQRSIR